jgi:hypothetical protein
MFNGLRKRGSPSTSLTLEQASGGLRLKRQGATLGSALFVKQRADNKTAQTLLGVLREASTLNGWKHDPPQTGSWGASP